MIRGVAAVWLACLLCLIPAGSVTTARPTIQTTRTVTMPCRDVVQAGPPLSHLVFSGPCRLLQTAAVACSKHGHNFDAIIHRRLVSGWTLDLSVEVGPYGGPGVYAGHAEFFMRLSRAGMVEAWAQHHATATVHHGETSITIAPATAEGYAGTVRVQAEHVSGTLQCLATS